MPLEMTQNAPRLFAFDEAPSFPTRAALRVLKSDVTMARLIERVGPLRLKPSLAESPFGALVHSIAHQQLNGVAAKTILGRVCALFPDPSRLDPHLMRELPDASLRGAGLSGAKLAAIRDLSEKAIDGTVPGWEELQRLSDEEIIERLTQVRGIGRWTVEMLLIFRLGRPDVWPVDDYGVRKGFARIFKKRVVPKPKALLPLGDRWRPFRSAATWYFWRAVELPPGAW
jgi:DNA-3-methyladenine glycosylase II